MSRSKVIYFTIGQRQEQVEIDPSSPAEDVKECFRAAAEAAPGDILKLYNTRDNIVNISQRLPENNADTRYRLEVVAAGCTNGLLKGLGVHVKSISDRLACVEKKVLVESGDTPSIVFDMRDKVEEFREKLENVEHLSWLGLFKQLKYRQQTTTVFNKGNIKKSEGHIQRVFEIYDKISTVEISNPVRLYLRRPTFDNWQWDDAEMMLLLRQMYIDLNLISTFNIEMTVLNNFLKAVYRNYNLVPFHNFRHCFCVAQMMYGLTWLIDLPTKLGLLDVLACVTSAICHDLDHPGYNNAYQVNAGTELALRYNDRSPLENHHCAVAFDLLKDNECNIFRNVNTATFKRIRESMIECVLATDMARHNEILGRFKSIVPEFDFDDKEHKVLLLRVLMKVSDISNEARPMEVAEPWLDCLLQEFFSQSDTEKLEGLPVAPFMDREKVTKPSSQVGFIRFVLLPLFESLSSLFPNLEEHILDPVRQQLDYYTAMNKAVEDERKRRELLTATENYETQPDLLSKPRRRSQGEQRALPKQQNLPARKTVDAVAASKAKLRGNGISKQNSGGAT